MKFTRYIFMLFVLVCTSLNSSFLNKKDVKKFLNFVNPVATFQPSSISSGHAQYFEPNELSNIQKSDTKIMLARLRYLRCFYSLGGIFQLFFEKGYKQVSGMIVLAASLSYVYELKQFEKKLDQSLSSKTNNPSKND